MSDEELIKNIKKYKIYARTEPQHKIRIVNAWQARGEAVAMVGDGVNDSPAIKGADIGISLGSGTEAAKEAADLVLLNDDFNIIVEAVRESRIILDNIKKSISYVLAESFTAVVLVGSSKIIFGWPLPVLPVQILWNNIIEDTLPDIAFAFEKGDKNILERKPIPLKQSLLNKQMKFLIFSTGLVDEFLVLGLFWFLYFKLGANIDYVRTMIFGSISLNTAFVIFSYKNFYKNIWQIKIFDNCWMLVSSIFVLTAFAIAIYIPFLQRILNATPLSVMDWIILIIIGLVSVFLIELLKFMTIRSGRK